jgi:hypothetical protein
MKFFTFWDTKKIIKSDTICRFKNVHTQIPMVVIFV